MTNFTQLYVDVILLKLLKQLESNNKKLATTSEKRLAQGLARPTQQFWKSVNRHELAIKEVETIKERIKDLNEQTHFMNMLHQDRFKFVEKYKYLLEEIGLRSDEE